MKVSNKFSNKSTWRSVPESNPAIATAWHKISSNMVLCFDTMTQKCKTCNRIAIVILSTSSECSRYAIKLCCSKHASLSILPDWQMFWVSVSNAKELGNCIISEKEVNSLQKVLSCKILPLTLLTNRFVCCTAADSWCSSWLRSSLWSFCSPQVTIKASISWCDITL